ncbi:uncharacterized protein LOC118159728 isoform X2 [Oxyura jamaicensis]|uniref:uncharacterized protein LOC118159728 isoform X2 n=1 Tax=Oxyura jamaicensis TaxID=8884 RepID=UPI0015A714EC|nr:uncharacterized protein LOC118159728 isoform X2 [Oxyura jamaicensis]
MLAQNNIPEEEFGNPLHLRSYLRHPSPAMRLTVLRGLSAVSESPEKARKIQVLLPDILEALQDTNTDVVLKALLVLRNVMAHVESREASCVAPQLAEKLLPLFDHESSLVREHSISLFQALTEDLLSQRKEMKRAVHSSLLPLYFRMRDQSESVAKASGEALIIAAEFLRHKELKHLAQTEQTWKIGECLVRTNHRPQPQLGKCAWPELLPAAASSLPSFQHRASPRGLFCRPLCPPCPQDAGGDPGEGLQAP